MIRYSPGHQPLTGEVIRRQKMKKIASLHVITFFLVDFAGITAIANKQCVYEWNVGVRFEGDEERDLKIFEIEYNVYQTI